MHAKVDLVLRRQRAVVLLPRGKALGDRRYDVPQHLAPESGEARRFRAVEGHLELFDRGHWRTITGVLLISPGG